MIDQLLRLLFGELPFAEVALDVDVEEGGIAADAHRRAVLIFDGGEIAEVQPLDGLLRVLGGAGDIEAVLRRHRFERLQCLDLLGDFLTVADAVGRHVAVDAGFILFALLDEVIDAVERHAAIVPHDAAAAVGIGKTR